MSLAATKEDLPCSSGRSTLDVAATPLHATPFNKTQLHTNTDIIVGISDDYSGFAISSPD